MGRERSLVVLKYLIECAIRTRALFRALSFSFSLSSMCVLNVKTAARSKYKWVTSLAVIKYATQTLIFHVRFFFKYFKSMTNYLEWCFLLDYKLLKFAHSNAFPFDDKFSIFISREKLIVIYSQNDIHSLNAIKWFQSKFSVVHLDKDFFVCMKNHITFASLFLFIYDFISVLNWQLIRSHLTVTKLIKRIGSIETSQKQQNVGKEL